MKYDYEGIFNELLEDLHKVLKYSHTIEIYKLLDILDDLQCKYRLKEEQINEWICR